MSKGKSERAAEPGGAAAARPGPFPGGRSAPEPGELRIAVDKKPYAEIIGHAVLEPDVEVCGVLVGRVGQDEHGQFVHVTAAIRGQAAKQEGAAVTFTHETWNHIHQELDARYPEAQIVGWYHTHGGFGVFLSEMDTFVHRNFFPEPFHLAYVYDPLAGSEAFFHPEGKELVPARRYWLAGRERRPVARQPEPEAKPVVAARPPPEADPTAAALERAVLRLTARPQPGGGAAQYAPWVAVALVAALVLMGPRSQLGEARSEGAPRPVLVLDQDPESGRALGIPVEVLEPGDGFVLRDAQGNPRQAIPLQNAQGLVGALKAIGPTPEQRAAEQRRAAAARVDQAAVLRLLGWAALAVALLATAASTAWYFLVRRR